MDAEDELKELEEHAEQGASRAMRPVALTMSILAVIVAVITMLGERAHTSAIINQAKASDQWNLYQSKKTRANDTGDTNQILSVVTLADKENAKRTSESNAHHIEKWADDTKEEEESARSFEEKVEQAEFLGNRFNLAQVLLEIALVVTSITLLTRSKIYWYIGIVFAVGGIGTALSVLFLK